MAMLPMESRNICAISVIDELGKSLHQMFILKKRKKKYWVVINSRMVLLFT
jgi:hypothetical protein